MSNRVDFKLLEAAIALTAKDLNPNILNPDFLKYSDIVPDDWELAKPPVYTNQVVQLAYQAGVSLVAQTNRITFVEAIGSKDLQELLVATVARKFALKLPKVGYLNISINPTGYVAFDSEEAAHHYLCQTLLMPGEWQEFGEDRMSAGLRLNYRLKRGQFNLGINQTILKFPDQTIFAILFAGNFDYRIEGDTPTERLQHLQQIAGNWKADIANFQSLVEEKFIASKIKSAMLLPSLAG